MAPDSPRPGGPEPLAVPQQDAKPDGGAGARRSRDQRGHSASGPAGAAPPLPALPRHQEGAPPFEVLVVDNGSAELPAEICAAFGARLLAEPVPGPGPARNRGAAAARGAILAFTDADCVIDPGWLAAIARRFGQDPKVGILGGDVRIALADPDRITAIEAYESIYAFRTRLYIERDRYVATLNMAVRRTVFEQVGPFGGIEIAEDIDWGQRATALGLPMVYEPAARVQHPARPDFAALCRKWDRHRRAFLRRGAPPAALVAALDREGRRRRAVAPRGNAHHPALEAHRGRARAAPCPGGVDPDPALSRRKDALARAGGGSRPPERRMEP